MEPIGRRLHLLELEDQAWFPSAIRDAMTDYLSFLALLTKFAYRPFVERLAAAMRVTGDDRVIDLCAGGAGPGVAIARQLAEARGGGAPVRVTLTDLYPNLRRFEMAAAASGGTVDFVPEPVDATDVPPSLNGFRLVVNAFHHLPPELATRLLADAVRKRQGVAVLELLERTPLGMALSLLTLPVLYAATPFIRPFRLSRLAMTYALPIVPAAILWDGSVSALRIYSPTELRELTAAADPGGTFIWDIGRLPVPGVPTKVTYLIGRPGGRPGDGV